MMPTPTIERLLVTGGRDYSDRDCVSRTLGPIFAENPRVTLIEGGARGADQLCKEFAMDSGIFVVTVEADWKKHGKGAGPRRNAEMLKKKPDLLIAFPGGNGTSDMVHRCQRSGVPVIFAK